MQTLLVTNEMIELAKTYFVIKEDGAAERKIEKWRVSRAYRDIVNGRDTSDLDVRCYNCNILYEYEQGRRNLPLNWKTLYDSGT